MILHQDEFPFDLSSFPVSLLIVNAKIGSTANTVPYSLRYGILNPNNNTTDVYGTAYCINGNITIGFSMSILWQPEFDYNPFMVSIIGTASNTITLKDNSHIRIDCIRLK